jgi:hypothetical protein
VSYFLSELAAADVAAGAAAAGLGAETGVASLAAGLVEASGAPVEPSVEEAAGFAEPYPSAYQPPPFKEKAGAEMTRLSAPPQCGQDVISGSENF